MKLRFIKNVEFYNMWPKMPHAPFQTIWLNKILVQKDKRFNLLLVFWKSAFVSIIKIISKVWSGPSFPIKKPISQSASSRVKVLLQSLNICISVSSPTDTIPLVIVPDSNSSSTNKDFFFFRGGSSLWNLNLLLFVYDHESHPVIWNSS